MRIISGEFRSRRLTFPRTKKTRPMTDRARESIFNILGKSVAEATVLDLFAGSGSLGLEALSRGASHATFVEKGPWARKSIRENLRQLGLEKRGRVLSMDIFQALRWLQKRGEKFSVIFLDPPYNKGVVRRALNWLEVSDIVSPFSQIVVHHSRQEKLPDSLEGLNVVRERHIGQACLSFLSKRGHD